MRKFTKKQYLAAGVAAVVIAGGAGAAFAYWTSSGGGSGTATTGTQAANTISVTDDSASTTGMFPGDLAQTVTLTVKNTGAASAYVAGVKSWLTVAPVGTGTCSADDYKLQGSPAPGSLATAVAVTGWVAEDLAPTATSATHPTVTIQFNDKGTPQDGCQGATVTIHYASN